MNRREFERIARLEAQKGNPHFQCNVRIFKSYLDEEEWEEVSLEQVEEWLGSYYIDVELVLDDLLSGQIIHTDVAEYCAKWD